MNREERTKLAQAHNWDLIEKFVDDIVGAIKDIETMTDDELKGRRAAAVIARKKLNQIEVIRSGETKQKTNKQYE